MKTLLITAILFTSFSLSTNASARIYKDTAGISSLSQWLTAYYDLKNALVSGDAGSAATKAGVLLSDINSIDPKTLSAAEQKALTALQPKLSYDARHISEVKDINHQREHFASLSLNMYALAKSAKLSARPIYKDYCPMKKAWWLSGESAIQNPYYGSQMLTCGQIKETLQ